MQEKINTVNAEPETESVSRQVRRQNERRREKAMRRHQNEVVLRKNKK